MIKLGLAVCPQPPTRKTNLRITELGKRELLAARDHYLKKR